MIENKYNISLPKRKPTRLKGYDYSTSGAYFITICVKDKKQMLSKIIVGDGVLDVPQNHLSNYGSICDKYIKQMNEFYKHISVDKYVIMPNHIHIIMVLDNTAGASPCPTISDVIGSFKSLTTRICNKTNNKSQKIFQTSFHDHIIRDEKDYEKIWKYIDTNPLKWELDCFYNEKMPQ